MQLLAVNGPLSGTFPVNHSEALILDDAGVMSINILTCYKLSTLLGFVKKPESTCQGMCFIWQCRNLKLLGQSRCPLLREMKSSFS